MPLWDLSEQQDMKTRGARDGTTDLYVLHIVVQSQHLGSQNIFCEPYFTCPTLSFVNRCQTKARCINRAIKLTSGQWITRNLLGTTQTQYKCAGWRKKISP